MCKVPTRQIRVQRSSDLDTRPGDLKATTFTITEFRRNGMTETYPQTIVIKGPFAFDVHGKLI
jgi:hypothetical protein